MGVSTLTGNEFPSKYMGLLYTKLLDILASDLLFKFTAKAVNPAVAQAST